MNQGKSLTAKTIAFARENKWLSWYYFISTLLLTGMAFVAAFKLTFVPLRLVCSILAGMLTCRLFVLYHDFQHEAIMRNSILARMLMNTIGLITLSPTSIWMETHQHHHTHNSKFSRVVMGSFPTLNVKTFRESTPHQRLRYLIIRHPLTILFAYLPIFLVSFCLWPFFENPKKYYDCGIAVLLHGIIYWIVCMQGGWMATVFTVLLPHFSIRYGWIHFLCST